MPPTDLLLINASNLPRNLIYPYAFVQVRALARHRSLSCVSYDLIGVPVERYRSVVSRLILRYQPRLIGITLRQADSITHREYGCAGWKPYFPVEDTDALIKAIRQESDVPIALGGFGFTTHAPQLFEHLRPDFGVQGEPDALFDHFEDIVRHRDCAGIDNVIYWDHGAACRNARVYYPPFNDREYDDEVVAELEAFYGRAKLYGDCPPAVAVELSRGCVFRCQFCTEPFVKGRRVRQRDLDPLIADVAFLARRGLRRFFLICSELNMGDAALALEVAERFLRLNEELGTPGVRWHAYHLPRWLSRSDIQTLYRSGFAGGWNDFPSFDDENLVKLRVPYRTRHVIEHLKDTMELHGPVVFGEVPYVNFFLGNAHATPATVARSLKAFHDAGLLPQVDIANIDFGTRLFAPEGRPVTASPRNAITYTSAGPSTRIDVVHPTFCLAPELEAHLGPLPEEHRRFFRYVETTLLSDRHAATKNWSQFLAAAAPPRWIAQQLAPHRSTRVLLPRVQELVGRRAPEQLVDPIVRLLDRIVQCDTGGALEEFVLDPLAEGPAQRYVAAAIVSLVSHPVPARYLEILDALGLPYDRAGTVPSSSYDVLVKLLTRVDTVPELIGHVKGTFGLEEPSKEIWLLRRLLYEKNVILKPEYRPLLVVQGVDPCPA